MSTVDEVLLRKKLFQEREGVLKTKLKEVKKTVEDSGVIKAFEGIEKSEITMLSRLILCLAIVGDIFGLIPFVGNVLGLVFGTVLIVLYFFNGLGRGGLLRRKVRRWSLRGVLCLIEFLAIGFSWLSLFTTEALIDFYLSKKGYYRKIEKANKVIEKLK